MLLNVSITLSPPSLDANTISIISSGCDLTTRHETISPPTGVMALSTSAGVVPGAKFCPSTANGPARPRIVRPLGAALLLLLLVATTLTWSLSVSMASPTAAASLARRFAALLLRPPPPPPAAPAILPPAAAGAAPGWVMRALRPPPMLTRPGFLDTVWCRSCVHSPLTSPAGTLARRPTVMARWGICLSRRERLDFGAFWKWERRGRKRRRERERERLCVFVS